MRLRPSLLPWLRQRHCTLTLLRSRAQATEPVLSSTSCSLRLAALPLTPTHTTPDGSIPPHSSTLPAATPPI